MIYIYKLKNMFSQGQLIFAIFFFISFIYIIVYSYRKDIEYLKDTYKGVLWVLIGFIVFFSLLVFLKSIVNG